MSLYAPAPFSFYLSKIRKPTIKSENIDKTFSHQKTIQRHKNPIHQCDVLMAWISFLASVSVSRFMMPDYDVSFGSQSHFPAFLASLLAYFFLPPRLYYPWLRPAPPISTNDLYALWSVLRRQLYEDRTYENHDHVDSTNKKTILPSVVYSDFLDFFTCAGHFYFSSFTSTT